MSAVAKANTAWGQDIPDWVVALAEACELTSQNQVAKRLGHSGALVSYVLSNSYTGDVDRIEAKVRAILMRDVVECPELGEIAASVCKGWQEKSTTFRAVNPMRVQMFRACLNCPRNQEGDSDA